MTKTNKLNSPVKHIKEVHSPIRWFGGKYYLAKDIIPLMPKHHCYVEPFGGGGHVLTQKEESKVEVWNDIDSSLINFLMTLRGRKEDLTKALETLPTSRFLTELWLKEPMPEDSFEKAVRWYYLLRQTIVPTNNQKSGWRAGKIKNTAFDFQNSIQRLNDFEKRIRRVMIECLDFRELIRKYDSPETFFFIDPPYVGREGMYKGGFEEKDHRELAELLRNIEGKALVSYYPDPLIEELYGDWRSNSVKALVGCNVTKASLGQKKKVETELFLMNYEEDGTKINFSKRDLLNQEQQMQLLLF
ncbi:DNA adenine methylase [Bacillus sp. Brlt_9]|uniref:DNA adenine methylase n=1 Tax=Bacillus sp. Brlt_9 TaxID=3110916 RepID=UPI003F7B8054